MSFQLPSALPPGAAAAVARARFAGGYDRVPFPTAVSRADGVLELSRPQHESAYIAVPWPVPGVGYPVSVSATLRERDQPYRLLVELARGKINQVRNVAADVLPLGGTLGGVAADELAAATAHLSRAVQTDSAAEADDLGEKALAAGYRAAADLTNQLVSATLKERKQREKRLPTQLACQLTARPPAGTEGLFAAAFTAAAVVPEWSRIEPSASHYDWSSLDAIVDWATGNNMPVRLGPLVDLGGDALPDWLASSFDDPVSLAAFFCDFIETAVHRYRGRVADWVVCGGFNQADALGLGEDDRIRLVVRLVDAARNADPNGRWVVGLAQPWGEYLERDECTYSPMVFADTLLRAGLPLTGFQLELFAGTGGRESMLRDGLDTVRLLDLFGVLGVPLDVLLRHPGRPAGTPSTTVDDALTVRTDWRGTDSANAQAEWGAMTAAVSIGLSHVRSVTWGRWADGPGGDPTDGLLGPDNRPKPLLDRLRRLRDDYL